jgi:hypothetical protein
VGVTLVEGARDGAVEGLRVMLVERVRVPEGQGEEAADALRVRVGLPEREGETVPLPLQDPRGAISPSAAQLEGHWVQGVGAASPGVGQ